MSRFCIPAHRPTAKHCVPGVSLFHYTVLSMDAHMALGIKESWRFWKTFWGCWEETAL